MPKTRKTRKRKARRCSLCRSPRHFRPGCPQRHDADTEKVYKAILRSYRRSGVESVVRLILKRAAEGAFDINVLARLFAERQHTSAAAAKVLEALRTAQEATRT